MPVEMTSRRLPLAAGLVLIGAMLLPPCIHVRAQEGASEETPKTVERVMAAVVNGDPIWSLELEKEVSMRLLGEGIPEELLPEEQRKHLTRQVLDALILEKLRLQKCDELGIEINDQQVDMAIEEEMAEKNVGTLSEFYTLWKEATGDSRKEAREHFRNLRKIQTLYFTRVFSSNFITPEELRAYYHENKEAFKTETRYKYQQILISRKNPEIKRIIQSLRTDLASDVSFDEMIRRYSQGPRKASGGWIELTEKGLDDWDDAIADAIRGLEVGAPSEVIFTRAGPMVFLLHEKEVGKAIPFAEAQDQIRRKITIERRITQEKRFDRQLRRTATIKVLIR